MSEVTLESLLGAHILTGVDFSTAPPVDVYDEASEVCAFVIDGVTHIATEDANDGYRSMLGSLIVSDAAVGNTFPPCNVIAEWMPDDEYNKNEILCFRDVVTGNTVLEIGTGNSDDYYPYFVAKFDPAAMAVNAVQP